jgi:hypothetical protein
LPRLGVAATASASRHSRDVYVADDQNNRVEKFTSKGKFLLKFGNPR